MITPRLRVTFKSFEGCRDVVLDDGIRGRAFLVKLLGTYCVSPAGKYVGMCFLLSYRLLIQGLRLTTETRRRASAPGMSEGRAKQRSLAPAVYANCKVIVSPYRLACLAGAALSGTCAVCLVSRALLCYPVQADGWSDNDGLGSCLVHNPCPLYV